MTGPDATPAAAPRRPDPWLLAAVLAAGLLRLALALWPAIGGQTLHLPDSYSYHHAAVTLVDRGELWFDTVQRAKREPGYPLFLAFWYALLGPHPVAVRLVQAALGGLLCLPVYSLARGLAGRRAGRVAAAAVALDPYGAVFSVLILTEGLQTLLLWVALWAMGKKGVRYFFWKRCQVLFRKKVPDTFFPLAAWAGLAALRSETVALFAGVAAAALIFCRERRAVVRPLAAGLVGIAAVVGLWAWRNQRVVGAPVLTTLNIGETLCDSFRPGADGSSDKTFMREILTSAAWRALPDEVSRDRWLRRQALEWVRENPGRAVALAWRKVARLWSPMPSAAAPEGEALRLVLGGAFMAQVLAALVGCVRHRRRWRQWLVFLVPALVVTAIHLVIVGSIRYRIPVMPFFAVMAGAAFSRRVYSPGSAPRQEMGTVPFSGRGLAC